MNKKIAFIPVVISGFVSTIYTDFLEAAPIQLISTGYATNLPTGDTGLITYEGQLDFDLISANDYQEVHSFHGDAAITEPAFASIPEWVLKAIIIKLIVDWPTPAYGNKCVTCSEITSETFEGSFFLDDQYTYMSGNFNRTQTNIDIAYDVTFKQASPQLSGYVEAFSNLFPSTAGLAQEIVMMDFYKTSGGLYSSILLPNRSMTTHF